MSMGAKRIMGFCLLISSLATLALSIIYILPRTHVVLVVIFRGIVGLGHGALFPATYTLWAHWAVPHERGTLTALSFSGTHVGTCKFILHILYQE